MAEPVSIPADSGQQSSPTAPRPPARGERVRALRGKYGFVPFTSEDHALEKRRELEREK